MVYFFQRGETFVRCELRECDKAFVITITDPNGSESSEALPTSDAAFRRWVELQGQLVVAGWNGPHGRE